MSVLIGVGIVTTITTIYLGKKGWQALHKAVGITPGVLTYQDDQAPLSLSAVTWRHLRLHKKHLQRLPNDQLRQLQRIDDKVSRYQSYQKTQQADDKTPTVTESQFVLQKLLYTRLPDTLASYDYLVSIDSADLSQTEKKKTRTKETRVHQRNTRAREQTREIELPSKEIEKKGFALVCVSLNFSCVPVKIPRSCMSV